MKDITQFLDGNVFGAMAMDQYSITSEEAAMEKALRKEANKNFKILMDKAFPPSKRVETGFNLHHDQGTISAPACMGDG